MAEENKSESSTCLDSAEKPEEHITPPKPDFHKPTIICIGEYPTKILLRGSLVNTNNEPLPTFIDRYSKDITEWSQPNLNPGNILGLDLNIDTHFWFQVLPYIANEGGLLTRLKEKNLDNSRGTVIVSSLWDGVSSSLLPALISQLKELNTNTIAFGVLPSKMQLPDVHFNALSSIGMCVSKDFASFFLLDRDLLEKYVGVDRKGSILKGNVVLNYLLELMASKETFVQELTELSRTFNVKLYTILSAAGASFRIYGSIENIFNIALSKSLLKIDVASAAVLYVLLRMPIDLKDKFSREKIELSISNWIREKANFKSIRISEPLYVDDNSDRIDVVMFVGGFDLTQLFTSMEKKVSAIKSYVVGQGSIKEEEWRNIIKSILAK